MCNDDENLVISKQPPQNVSKSDRRHISEKS